MAHLYRAVPCRVCDPRAAGRLASVLVSCAAAGLLAGCGGGDPGGGAGLDNAVYAQAQQAREHPLPQGSHGVVYDPATGSLTGTDKPNMLRGTDGPDQLRGLGGHDVLFGEAGDDWLDGGPGRDRMAGGPGNDRYVVDDSSDQVVERANEGRDEVHTVVDFTLPPEVEELRVDGPGGDPLVLTGNALDNVIVGAPFGYESIYGLEGNDILDGGGRHGGRLDGGPGNDRLLESFGELIGGPGADVFVAAGRGAMTSPDAPITILDFNGAEGDRIEIPIARPVVNSAQLFDSGVLRFDPATSTLVLDLDPSTTAPWSVDQVIVMPGVQSFDPSWITVGS